MKIAFILCEYVCPNPLDFNNIYDDPRGLSGSDTGIIRTAEEFVKMKHDVSLFTVHRENKPNSWRGVKLYHINELQSKLDKEHFDAVVSWCDPTPLKFVKNEKTLRIVSSQLNGFLFCEKDFDKYVDIHTSPSEKHCEYQKSFNLTDPNKWHIIPNGCDPEVYSDDIKKIEGRVIWASSWDRGLHLLLSCWPEIKKRVPKANLKVFYNYNFDNTGLLDYQKNINNTNDKSMETAQRIRYCLYAIPKLKKLDVEMVGSVSKSRIIKEMNEAMVLGFPCSVINFTEGFSCTTLEAMSAKACPIISKADALGSIYKDVVPMIDCPAENHLKEFVDLVVKGLINEEFRNSVNEKCKKFADELTWPKIAKQYENLIFNNLKEKPIELDEPKIRLNIGSGPDAYPGWINYDKNIRKEHFNWVKSFKNIDDAPEHLRPLIAYYLEGKEIDIREHDIKNKFELHEDNSVDFIYVGQAIEHINPITEAPPFIKECYRMLKPGGILRMSTPDLDLIIKAYIANEMYKFIPDFPPFYMEADSSSQLAHIMYGSAGPESTWNNYEGHQFLYGQKSMNALLSGAGFVGPFNYYYESGKGINKELMNGVIDRGMTHSFIVEAIK